MRRLQKTELSGYRQKNRLEVEGCGVVHSISHGEMQTQNGVSSLFEKILDRNNLNQAYLKVVKNKGAAGIDHMPYTELLSHLRENRESLLEQLRDGTYKPQAVLRVEIPKSDGGKRKLGIPTVVDRMVQQAILQVIASIFEIEFSENSFGFRPKRSTHDAVKRAKSYYEEGYRHVVDLDLKQYFDTINHDKLMYFVEKKVQDKQVLKLIRKYLQSGVMMDGLFHKTEEGAPQGGNLSPLLSNIYLHEFDKELERRGHKFVRFADDCNIYVKSDRAGQRVFQSVSNFLEKKLNLTVNWEKSEVGSPTKLPFLGFCIHPTKYGVKLRVHHKPKTAMKKRLKAITKRNRGVRLSKIIAELKQYMTGWLNYYGMGKMKKYISSINGWLKRRLRQYIWKQWKKPKTRVKNLKKLGIPSGKAYEWGNTRKGYWRIANSYILHRSITDERLAQSGYQDFLRQYKQIHLSY
jgi:RNA-directed DNA polymerase